jgi:putative copper export protein
MNQPIAKYLVFVFFLAVGAFNIARGIASIRARNESTWIGRLRVTLGVLMLIIPIVIGYLLTQG